MKDKEFLERALDASTTNPVLEIKRSIEIVKQSEDDVDTIIENLENLQDWCGQIDFATGIHLSPNSSQLGQNRSKSHSYHLKIW